jgi:hypothetical protein
MMDSNPRISRAPGVSTATKGLQNNGSQAATVLDDYVLSGRTPLSPTDAATHDDQIALASKLNGIGRQYAQFFRSIEPCALASCYDLTAHVKAAAPSRSACPSRSTSEGVRSSGDGERLRNAASSKSVAGATGPHTAVCVPPDLDSFWMATSPFPPTAVLTALYSVLPLRKAVLVNSESVVRGGEETHIERSVDEIVPAQQPTASLESVWTLCRSAESAEVGERHVSFWEAYAMTAMAVHRAAGSVSYSDGSADSSQGSSSSASSFSLAQQLRRATAALASMQHSNTTSPGLSAATTLLEWPEEFLWNLLMSLLSALALLHSAGLHFFGQLTAADVLCLSCFSSLPRQLEQTWHDVVAAAVTAQQSIEEGKVDSAALFQRFYLMSSQSLLLPQASLTPDTPCHSAFFVVQPSVELLSKQSPPERNTDAAPFGSEADKVNFDATSSVANSTAAQATADETPEQQARFQAADLASVGRLLTTIMELRAQRSSLTATSTSATTITVAHPSSELVFLVRRLCECKTAADSVSPSRGFPTALQLLQLQALRLRTEAWYYHRLAAETCDRLAQTQHTSPTLGTPAVVSNEYPHGAVQWATQVRTAEAEEERLRAREAAVTEREAKLDLILRVYELTHEHLDAINLPPSQGSSPDEDATHHHMVHKTHESPQRSPAPREDSLEVLLGIPSYRQAATTTTTPPPKTGAPLLEARRAPITNISHQQHRGVPTGAAAETPKDALPGLSPLARVPRAEDADAALPSVGDTPVMSLCDGAQDAPPPPPPDSRALARNVSATHRTLGVDPAPVAFRAAHDGGRGSAPFAAALQLPTVERQTLQTAMATHADVQTTDKHTLLLSPQLTQWNAEHAQTQQISSNDRARLRSGDDVDAPVRTSEQVTVVEVELDDSSDAEDIMPRALSTPQPYNAAQHCPELVVSSHPSPPPSSPPAFFLKSSSASPPTHIAQALKTPVRAPALPNMGVVDADVSGVSAGGVGGSHSKYSALALLRTPPSARHPPPAAGGRRRDASSSPSQHPLEGHQASAKPNVTASTTHTTAAREASQPQRSSRRRSGSRGSSRGDILPSTMLSPSAAASPGVSLTSTSISNENGEWARQQLTELQKMQSALRSQQPATPRSRASVATGTAEGGGGVGERATPEPRRTRSTASSPSSSPPQPVHGVVSTPPSPSLQATITPLRGSADVEASLVKTDSSHRTPHTSHVQQGPHYLLREPGIDGAARDKPPVQVQGTSWLPTSSTGVGAASSTQTPPYHRQRYDDARWTPNGVSSAAHRPISAASGFSTPHTKTPHPTLGLNAAEDTAAAGGGGRTCVDARTFPFPYPYFATTTTSATAAALGAALRTPPRQTVPWTATVDLSELYRLTSTVTSTGAHLPSSSTHGSARKSDGAAVAVHPVRSARRPAASVEGNAEGAVRGASRLSMMRKGTPPAVTSVPSGIAAKERSPQRTTHAGGGDRLTNGSPSTSPSRVTAPRTHGGSPASNQLTSASPSSSTPLASLAQGPVGAGIGKATAAPPLHGGASSSTSAMELLRRLRASSTATPA